MDQSISEETGKSLIQSMQRLSVEMAKFSDLFVHIEKKKTTEREIKSQSKRASEAFKNTFKRR